MNDPRDTETAAIPRAAAAEALEQLLLPLMGRAYGTAYRLTRNSADAEDLVQESVLLAVRGFASFRQGTKFKPWFFRILTNAYFSKYRQLRRRGLPVELEDTPELYLFTQTSALGMHAMLADPAERLMERFDGELVESALDRLPEEYRAVAILYFINDLSYDDIATSLEIPIGTVRSRLHRARRMLQGSLWRTAVDRGIVDRLQGEPA